MDLTKTQSYAFDLPPELIAQKPLSKRDDCRLLVGDPLTATYFDSHFRDLTELLGNKDLLVLNTSRVRQSRLYLRLEGSDRAVEVLLLSREAGGLWSAICKPGKKIKAQSVLSLHKGVRLRCLGREGEVFFFKFEAISLGESKKTVKALSRQQEEEMIESLGHLPLPPYIKTKDTVAESYQTVYSQKKGSAAAPTAGLHFTDVLLKALKEKGVEIVELDLQIGLGTFKPVQTKNIRHHPMHAESYSIRAGAANRLNRAVRKGKRIIAVGTSSLRALEDNWKREGQFIPGDFSTDIFIYPPQRIRSVQGLITNFHLPQSTLIMLVAAMGGPAFIQHLYQHAIFKRYRFYSFGDAMFLQNAV